MYSENPISEGKLIKSYDDLREKTLEFARSILSIELEIRELKNQIKELFGLNAHLVCLLSIPNN